MMRGLTAAAFAVLMGASSAVLPGCREGDVVVYVMPDCKVQVDDLTLEPDYEYHTTSGVLVAWCNKSDDKVVITVSDGKLLGGADSIRLEQGECVERYIGTLEPGRYELRVYCGDEMQTDGVVIIDPPPSNP